MYGLGYENKALGKENSLSSKTWESHISGSFVKSFRKSSYSNLEKFFSQLVWRLVGAFEFITLACEPLRVEFIALSREEQEPSLTIIDLIKCLSFSGDTLKLYLSTYCIMILWSSQSTLIVSWYNEFQYQKWKRHEMGLFSCTFHASIILDMCTECIMILSSSEFVLNVSWYNQG